MCEDLLLFNSREVQLVQVSVSTSYYFAKGVLLVVRRRTVHCFGYNFVTENNVPPCPKLIVWDTDIFKRVGDE